MTGAVSTHWNKVFQLFTVLMASICFVFCLHWSSHRRKQSRLCAVTQSGWLRAAVSGQDSFLIPAIPGRAPCFQTDKTDTDVSGHPASLSFSIFTKLTHK